MVRVAPISAALLVVAAAIALCTGTLTYEIEVINLTYMQPFSQVFLVAHTKDFSIFQVGTNASDELREVAETGGLDAINMFIDTVDTISFVCGLGFGLGDLNPGEAETITLEVDEVNCANETLLTMVTMLVNTNDAFTGIDSMPLLVNESSTVFPNAFDAGTEINTELCVNIPGPACDDATGNDVAEPGEGFIHQHRGFQGVAEDLPADIYDWRNPVAEVFIDVPTSA